MTGLDPDPPTRERIERLVTEEQRIYAQSSVSELDHERLRAIQRELERYWDLLRERRALRESRRNPASSRRRPDEPVDHDRP